jgi:hypothetical protein
MVPGRHNATIDSPELEKKIHFRSRTNQKRLSSRSNAGFPMDANCQMQIELSGELAFDVMFGIVRTRRP